MNPIDAFSPIKTTCHNKPNPKVMPCHAVISDKKQGLKPWLSPRTLSDEL
jgi:hypothetical protein